MARYYMHDSFDVWFDLPIGAEVITPDGKGTIEGYSCGYDPDTHDYIPSEKEYMVRIPNVHVMGYRPKKVKVAK